MATKSLFVKSLIVEEPLTISQTNLEVILGVNLPEITLDSVGSGDSLVYEGVGPNLVLKSLVASPPLMKAETSVDGREIILSANTSAFDDLYALTLMGTGGGVNQVEHVAGNQYRIKDLVAGDSTITITQGGLGQANAIVANEPLLGASKTLNATPTIVQVLLDGSDVAWGTVYTTSTDISLANNNERATVSKEGDYYLCWSVLFTVSLLSGRMGVAVNGSYVGCYSMPGQLHQGACFVRLNPGDYVTIKYSGLLSATVDLSTPSSSYIYMRRMTNLG